MTTAKPPSNLFAAQKKKAKTLPRFPHGSRTSPLSQNSATLPNSAPSSPQLKPPPHNEASAWSYDAFGRVIETSFPSTHYEQYGYDAANNLISKTDRKGQTINYVYDDMYRLTQKTYPDSTS